MKAPIRTTAILLLIGIAIGRVALAGVPYTLNYQATLTDGSGQPVTGNKAITVGLYAVPTGGAPFWTETLDPVVLVDGRLSLVLGGDAANPLDPDDFTGETYIGIRVGSDQEMPRRKLTSVAYAFKAAEAIPPGVILMWSGSAADIPAGWALCDGNNGTPDLRDRFVIAAGNRYLVAQPGGEENVSLTVAEIPSHSHSIDPPNTNTNAAGNHSHRIPANDFTTSGSDRDDHVSGGRDRDANRWPSSEAAGNHQHSIDIPAFNSGATGGGAAHNNMPPYYPLAFIMKI